MRVVLDESDILDVSAAEFVDLHAPFVADVNDALLLRQVALDLLRVRGWKRVRTIYLDELERCVIFAHEPRTKGAGQVSAASVWTSQRSADPAREQDAGHTVDGADGDASAPAPAPPVVPVDTRVVVTCRDDATLDLGLVQRLMAALEHAALEPPVDESDRILVNEYTLAIVSRDSVTSFYDLVLGLDALTERHKHQFD
ncbi:hypothetical protein FVE85_7432 [Porphyridium purpureum]|uniref:Uncharacterized protein n=1 Tax=Porphyridium purpureum TaxID=35688 RepID=A0A5J4ZB21_PORPP|nr:hypothetical protein FVE85_7432 [Porphyridium purpureum]|eukprot:POR2128..scf295_1